MRFGGDNQILSTLTRIEALAMFLHDLTEIGPEEHEVGLQFSQGRSGNMLQNRKEVSHQSFSENIVGLLHFVHISFEEWIVQLPPGKRWENSKNEASDISLPKQCMFCSALCFKWAKVRVFGSFVVILAALSACLPSHLPCTTHTHTHTNTTPTHTHNTHHMHIRTHLFPQVMLNMML